MNATTGIASPTQPVSAEYGISKRETAESALERHVEGVRSLGYTILENVLGSGELESARTRLDAV